MNTYRTIGLVTYLSKVDRNLLAYVKDGTLGSCALVKLNGYAEAMANRELTTVAVVEDWPEFFELALAFVLAHGSFALRGLCERCQLFGAVRRGLQPEVTPWDRRCLQVLARETARYLLLRWS